MDEFPTCNVTICQVFSFKKQLPWHGSISRNYRLYKRWQQKTGKTISLVWHYKRQKATLWLTCWCVRSTHIPWPVNQVMGLYSAVINFHYQCNQSLSIMNQELGKETSSISVRMFTKFKNWRKPLLNVSFTTLWTKTLGKMNIKKWWNTSIHHSLSLCFLTLS